MWEAGVLRGSGASAQHRAGIERRGGEALQPG
jgi:hypothetical protein